MSTNKLQLLSPLFLKYQADFEKNPRSRVFAPLAETYRKLGMTDKAMEILSQGIRFHPSYLMGYLGLAFCYYDLKQFNLAYSTIRPLVESNRDNIRLQKLFSDVCLELGKKEEALETLKYLLFINPRDKDVAELVQRVEKEVDDRYKPHHKPIIIPENEFNSDTASEKKSAYFDLDKLTDSKQIAQSDNDFDDWMTVDLNPKQEPKTSVSYDHWNVKKIDEPKSYHVHLDLEEDSDPMIEAALQETLKPSPITEVKSDSPWVTHTLVDLYCGQGHIEKALEVLEKILLLNPNDQKTINKIKEIQALSQPLVQYDERETEIETETEPEIETQHVHVKELANLSDVSEEDGRRHLMSLIDEKLGPIEIVEPDTKLETARLIEGKLSLFLKKIQKRALDYQERV
jgi:tetratricopeptide (TPR) repeat protein